jgi:hypothetical protein
VSDVAANQSQWLVSPLQARQCLEAMAIHHGQLKAIYGISHLAKYAVSYPRRVMGLGSRRSTPAPVN